MLIESIFTGASVNNDLIATNVIRPVLKAIILVNEPEMLDSNKAIACPSEKVYCFLAKADSREEHSSSYLCSLPYC